jgi:hypothetical protein
MSIDSAKGDGSGTIGMFDRIEVFDYLPPLIVENYRNGAGTNHLELPGDLLMIMKWHRTQLA